PLARSSEARGTSDSRIIVPLFDLKFLHEFAAGAVGTIGGTGARTLLRARGVASIGLRRRGWRRWDDLHGRTGARRRRPWPGPTGAAEVAALRPLPVPHCSTPTRPAAREP